METPNRKPHEQERWQLDREAAGHYEHTVGPRFERLATLLLDGAGVQPGERVLDVACGTGIVARLAAARVKPSGSVFALDINPAMLDIGRRLAVERGLAIEWRLGDANALPFPEASFDVVLCQQGLQFFPDKAAALREMRRVVSSGGRIGLAVFGRPNRFILALAEALKKYADEKAVRQCLAPFAFGDPAVLQAIARDAGLGPVDIRPHTLTRPVEPSQEWLLATTSAFPYSAAITGMTPEVRAQVVRDIASALHGLWDNDHFAVPSEVFIAYIRV